MSWREERKKEEREKNTIYSGHLRFCLQSKGSARTPLGPMTFRHSGFLIDIMHALIYFVHTSRKLTNTKKECLSMRGVCKNISGSKPSYAPLAKYNLVGPVSVNPLSSICNFIKAKKQSSTIVLGFCICFILPIIPLDVSQVVNILQKKGRLSQTVTIHRKLVV